MKFLIYLNWRVFIMLNKFLSENFQVLVVKVSIYLNWRVLVMLYKGDTFGTSCLFEIFDIFELACFRNVIQIFI